MKQETSTYLYILGESEVSVYVYCIYSFTAFHKNINYKQFAYIKIDKLIYCYINFFNLFINVYMMSIYVLTSDSPSTTNASWNTACPRCLVS